MRELSHMRVFSSVCMAMSIFRWERTNFNCFMAWNYV